MLLLEPRDGVIWSCRSFSLAAISAPILVFAGGVHVDLFVNLWCLKPFGSKRLVTSSVCVDVDRESLFLSWKNCSRWMRICRLFRSWLRMPLSGYLTGVVQKFNPRDSSAVSDGVSWYVERFMI